MCQDTYSPLMRIAAWFESTSSKWVRVQHRHQGLAKVSFVQTRRYNMDIPDLWR